MTDTSLYTGSHKLRFDEEGKGRGLEGRDTAYKGKGSVPTVVGSDPSYVTGYKNEGTYSSSHKVASVDIGVCEVYSNTL